MGFVEDCVELFGTKDLYGILGLSSEADSKKYKPTQIKKAYYKQSLLFHPDRVGKDGKELATRRFQVLGRVHEILTDTEKRACYDDAGIIVDDDNVVTDDRDWETYWRLLFKPVTLEDLEAYKSKYIGSPEERTDLSNVYIRCDGNMTNVFEYMPCSDELTDGPRFVDILDAMIAEGELETQPQYTKTRKEFLKTKKMTGRQKREAKEAEQMLKEIKAKNSLAGGDDSLAAMIQKRQADRAAQSNSFLDRLAAKYGGGGKAKRKSASDSAQENDAESPGKRTRGRKV